MAITSFGSLGAGRWGWIGTDAERLAMTIRADMAGGEFLTSDGAWWLCNGTAWIQTHSGGAALVSDQTIHSGERNPTSTTTSYVVVRQECNLTVIGLTTAITIGGGVANDTHLMGINITTALTGTCVITGFADSAGAATSITFPAGAVGFKDFMGAINSAGALTVTCSNASDDNLVQVLWRPV